MLFRSLGASRPATAVQRADNYVRIVTLRVSRLSMNDASWLNHIVDGSNIVPMSTRRWPANSVLLHRRIPTMSIRSHAD